MPICRRLAIFSVPLLITGIAGPLNSEGFAAPPSGAASKVARYIDAVFARRDLDRNGVLVPGEWREMKGEPARLDQDQDGQVSKAEFERYIIGYGSARAPISATPVGDSGPLGQPSGTVEAVVAENGTETEEQSRSGERDPERAVAAEPRTTQFTVRASRGLASLPGWFSGRDRDGDGQLTLKEFVGDAAGSSREFERLDRNGDGVVTPHELKSPREPKPASNP